MSGDRQSSDDWLNIGRDHVAQNVAGSGADVIIAGLCDEVERLRGYLDTLQMPGNTEILPGWGCVPVAEWEAVQGKKP
jgi:hypothetical protein